MPFVSVIVPVYKSEQYLSRCVESVLAQSYDDFELLLVDDGDHGEAARMCDEYADRDTRVKVLHKENGGVSSARNMGLDHAEGDWIVFLDSDDWLDSDMLAFCVESCANADVIRCSQRFVYENGAELPMELTNYTSKEEYLRDVVDRKTALGVWAGMYKRSLFVTHNIRFDTDLVNGEDWLVLATLVYHSGNVSFINRALYFYNLGNQQSCTKHLSMEKILSCYHACQRIAETLRDRPDFQKVFQNVETKIMLDAKLACFNSTSLKLIEERVRSVRGEFANTQPRVVCNDKLTGKDKVKFLLLDCRFFRRLYWLKRRCKSEK